MQAYFPRNFDALEDIFAFSASFFERHRLAASLKFAVDVALEELVTNMIKYSPEGTHDIFVDLSVNDDCIIIQLVDKDVEPFDITASKAVDIKQPLNERTPGGLGLHFVKKMMDNIKYEYENRESKITLVKNI